VIRDFLFEHRYLMSEAVTAQRFTVEGLNSAIDDTIAILASPAGSSPSLCCRVIPTGEFLQVLNPARSYSSAAHVRRRVGVSRRRARRASSSHPRAHPGSDLDAQERAMQAIRAAFTAAQHASAESPASARRA